MKTRAPTSQEIEELVAFLPRLYAKRLSPVKEWHGGDKDDDGVITMPYPEYQSIVGDFFRVASGEFWTDYDYLSESKKQLLDDEEAIKTADLDQIKTMLTFCTRGERFCTGHWNAVIENGLVRQILNRLAELESEWTKMSIPQKSGLYIVRLKNVDPISVNANDKRIAHNAIKVTKANCKFGKADNLFRRKKNYDKVFSEKNVRFKPLVLMSEIAPAEESVLKMLDQYRIRGKTGRKNEWLENITPESAEELVFLTLDLKSFSYKKIKADGKLDLSTMRDSVGVQFSAELHVMKNGEPKLNKDGTFRKRPRKPIDYVY